MAVLLLTACGNEEVSVEGPTGDTAAAGLVADDIPVAHTPPGGYGEVMPHPVLTRCAEPLVDRAPDLRGLWQAVEVEVEGAVVDDHPVLGHVERIEQCGDRLVVTGEGIIHDMRVDGTEANGVHDVAAADLRTPVDVIATYEDGVHVLRPVGLPVEVTRRRDGEHLLWGYVGFTARLARIGDADDPHPPTEETP